MSLTTKAPAPGWHYQSTDLDPLSKVVRGFTPCPHPTSTTGVPVQYHLPRVNLGGGRALVLCKDRNPNTVERSRQLSSPLLHPQDTWWPLAGARPVAVQDCVSEAAGMALSLQSLLCVAQTEVSSSSKPCKDCSTGNDLGL